jgi:hypothetical protein
MRVDFARGSLVRELVVRDNICDVLGPNHHTLAKLEAPNWTQQFAVAPDRRQAGFVVGGRGAGARETGSFSALGIRHIPSGYDHLLFLVRLLLPGVDLVSLTKIITAFTIASLVLGLGLVLFVERALL